MEMNAVSSPSNEKQPSDCSTSVNGENKPAQKEVSASVFVNHAAIAWHESRKKWTGDQSRRPKRMNTDAIISWSTTYEELLSTNEPFSEPIPLPEEAIAEGVDDEEELKELRARLAKVRS